MNNFRNYNNVDERIKLTYKLARENQTLEYVKKCIINICFLIIKYQ